MSAYVECAHMRGTRYGNQHLVQVACNVAAQGPRYNQSMLCCLVSIDSVQANFGLTTQCKAMQIDKHAVPCGNNNQHQWLM